MEIVQFVKECFKRQFTMALLLFFDTFHWGMFNDYVDKKRWWVVKKCLFLSTFMVKNVHVEVGGGHKRAKLCPHSH